MELISRQLIEFWTKQINDYIRKTKAFAIDPLPKLELFGSDIQANGKDDLLISTGGYVPSTKTVILYIDNRHLKDILRSYCHELVHHNLNLENSDYIRRVFSLPQGLVDNPLLEEIEGDAYLRGNLTFRKFTEWFKKKHTK